MTVPSGTAGHSVTPLGITAENVKRSGVLFPVLSIRLPPELSVHLALEGGYRPHSSPQKESRALDWEDYIGEDYAITSPLQTQALPVKPLFSEWDPVKEISTYISTLFQAEENVGYVVRSWKNQDGKHLPDAGSCDRTAGKLLEDLTYCENDLGAVFGDYDPEIGAWIRFNPLDGKGGKNENVTDFRYALVESDGIPIEQQNGIMRDLQLPIACLVYSGASRGRECKGIPGASGIFVSGLRQKRTSSRSFL